MILVSRFVAEAVAEVSSDENIIIDNDERIEIRTSLSQLSSDEIASYVAYRSGSNEVAKSETEQLFGKDNAASSIPITILWEA